MTNDSTTYLHQHLESLNQKKSELEKLAAGDPELKSLAQEELKVLEQEISAVADTINNLENKSVSKVRKFKNCVLELRPGPGGEESKIWMGDLLTMYTKYALLRGFTVEPIDSDVIEIKGKTAYDTFRFESGVHRVQRVPETESSGRIHTSTASVACIPEIPETEVEINNDEIEWQFFRAGGHGGQNVNKLSTAVRLTHLPTGIVVTASRERRQEQNRTIALQLLRAKLWEQQEEERLAKLGDARAAIGRAQRAEKIRTYNFPQNRLTDHRLPKSWHDLDRRLQGDLDDIIESLKNWEKNQLEN
jgi:peptide chain release factor 1